MALPKLNQLSFPPLKMNRFLLTWLVTGVSAWLVPLIIMAGARSSLRRQQNYEQQQNGDGDQQQDENDGRYYNRCSWWQWFGCSNNYDENGEQDDGGNGEDEERTTPWWWFGSSEEARREREEMGRPSPALVFTYVWQTLLFASILYFGYRTVHNRSDLYRVVLALALFANISFIVMILLGGLEGGVQTEERELEEQGFYSQFAVMLFLSNLFFLVFSAVYGIIFFLNARKDGVTKIDYEENDYKIHSEVPEIQITDSGTNSNRGCLVLPELCVANVSK